MIVLTCNVFICKNCLSSILSNKRDNNILKFKALKSFFFIEQHQNKLNVKNCLHHLYLSLDQVELQWFKNNLDCNHCKILGMFSA